VRNRDPVSRRLWTISLTAEVDALSFRLRDAAVTFDLRRRSGVSDAKMTDLRRLLSVLHDNVAESEPTSSTRSES
jgi:hypothetical protein